MCLRPCFSFFIRLSTTEKSHIGSALKRASLLLHCSFLWSLAKRGDGSLAISCWRFRWAEFYTIASFLKQTIQRGTQGWRNSVSLGWLGMGAAIVAGGREDGSQVRPQEAGTGSKATLDLGRVFRTFPQVLGCATHWVCAFPGLSPLSLALLSFSSLSSSLPCFVPFLVVPTSSWLCLSTWLFRVQPLLTALTLQSQFLEIEVYFNTELALQRSPRRSKESLWNANIICLWS